MRICSIQSLLNNCEAVTDFLDSQLIRRQDYGAKCAGFLNHLTAFETYFMMRCLEIIYQRLELTASALQSQKLNISGISEAIEALVCTLREKRTDETFETFWSDVTTDAKHLSIDDPVLPRARRRPVLYTDGKTE